MKCKNCAFESEEAFEFCPLCGTAGGDDIGFADKVKGIITGNKFLAICILVTVVAGLSVFSSIDVFAVLFTVFLWMTYFSAKKGGDFGNNLRKVSGTTYAMYITSFVAGIIVTVCGVITAALSSFAAIDGLEDFIMSSIEFDAETSQIMSELSGAAAGVFVLAVGIVFVIVGVIVLLISILSLKKIHGFAKSVYTSVLSGNEAVLMASSAKKWLIVFGIFGAISAVSSLGQFLPALSDGCMAAAAFVASSLISDNF